MTVRNKISIEDICSLGFSGWKRRSDIEEVGVYKVHSALMWSALCVWKENMLTPMSGKNRRLVTDEPIEFDK